MSVDFENLNVLVVADPLPMKILLLPVLRTIGVNNILTSGNAIDGFDLFFKHAPDIVLADWYMAMSSGVDLTQRIRRVSLAPRHRTPILLMAGDEDTAADMISARNAGATALLLKPFAAEDLARLIDVSMNDKREFIESAAYIGPDRRKSVDADHTGPFRRANDPNIEAISRH